MKIGEDVMFLAEFSKGNQKSYLELAFALVNADGKVTDEELNTLNLYRAEIPDMQDIDAYRTDDISAAVLSLEKLDERSRKKIYFELISLAYTDNEFSDEEKVFINKIQAEFKLSETDCNEMDIIAEGLMKMLNKLGDVING